MLAVGRAFECRVSIRPAAVNMDINGEHVRRIRSSFGACKGVCAGVFLSFSSSGSGWYDCEKARDKVSYLG